VHFRDSKGDLVKTVEGNEGDSILDIAHEHDIDLEGNFLYASFDRMLTVLLARCMRGVRRLLDLPCNTVPRALRDAPRARR
jgi:hypothetical protein